jgi:hypothetical protein
VTWTRLVVGGALALGAAALACGPRTGAPASLSNVAPAGRAPGPLTLGDYACSQAQGGYRYPAFHCVVQAREGRVWLEKVSGSQRFRGWVSATDGGGFAFDGEMYCPWGDCTEPMQAGFVPDGAGVYRARWIGRDGEPDVITLRYTPGGYGGAGYGGGGYGGGGYGGYGYGAAGSGGAGYGGGGGYGGGARIEPLD